ncbi:MAG TPA: hypothetical protein VFZ56_09155 [Gemmatimonadaceae bacterium]
MTAARQAALALLLGVLTASCASATADPPGNLTSSEPDGRNVISPGEIAASTQTNALDLIRDRRPVWLRSRGFQNFDLAGGIDVYVDRTRMSFETLAEIPVHELERLEYLSASDATLRFGTQEGNPAIVVTTKRGR